MMMMMMMDDDVCFIIFFYLHQVWVQCMYFVLYIVNRVQSSNNDRRFIQYNVNLNLTKTVFLNDFCRKNTQE